MDNDGEEITGVDDLNAYFQEMQPNMSFRAAYRIMDGKVEACEKHGHYSVAEEG